MLVALAACSGDDGPPLTDATSLTCPAPGDLPFRLESRGFAKSENKTLAEKSTRSKDEAADSLGNTEGITAVTYIADELPAGPAAISYRGAKARTTVNGGLFNNPLAGEHVSLWFYDDGPMAWQALGRADTDANGSYEIASTFVAPNGKPIYSMLEADGSCVEHYDFLLPRNSKVIVTDIDGTLTLNDNELLMEVADGTYVQKPMGAAVKLMEAWTKKKYPVIYMTARPHLFRAETRVWLRDLGFPFGPLITANQTNRPAEYKTAWMKRMIMNFGWQVVAVYGNADTDITAYENAGVPKSQTFIVGELAGMRGTVPIPNLDFTDHISTYVNAQPDNQ